MSHNAPVAAGVEKPSKLRQLGMLEEEVCRKYGAQPIDLHIHSLHPSVPRKARWEVWRRAITELGFSQRHLSEIYGFHRKGIQYAMQHYKA